jgi:peptide/nickel transport system substrate-binding protein
MEHWRKGDYDAVYHHFLLDTDPAANLDWWLSNGDSHMWNPRQPAPATPWEAEIDALMQKQASTLDAPERKRLFTEVQRVFLAHNPGIYFATPRVYVATSRRVRHAAPALTTPHVLGGADELSVAPAAP